VVAGLGREEKSEEGKELFYLAQGKMMRVGVRTGAPFEAGIPEPAFDVRLGPITTSSPSSRNSWVGENWTSDLLLFA
jgi:hypothetical protein